MALQTLLGSNAIAEVAVNCGIEVVGAYPITPSTPIAHALNKHWANGRIPKFVAVESEHSAISVITGASAAGARVFSATSGQGLLLMHEVLSATSGMRIPVVMCVANRAISAPLNVWNDEQDTVMQRDAGWIQLYCKNNQEAVDTIPQAFVIAEKTYLPVMVCVDGFYLTHCVEQVEMPDPEKVRAFVGKYENPYKLDSGKPISLGVYAAPNEYQEFRQDFCADMEKALFAVEKAGRDYASVCGREYGFFGAYDVEGADRVMLSLGSVCTNIEKVVDKLRAKGEKVGVLHLRVYMPFPREQLRKALQGKHVMVIERDVSPGAAPPVFTDVSEALYGTGTTMSYAIGALGGRDVKPAEYEGLFARMKEGKAIRGAWIGQNPDATVPAPLHKE